MIDYTINDTVNVTFKNLLKDEPCTYRIVAISEHPSSFGIKNEPGLLFPVVCVALVEHKFTRLNKSMLHYHNVYYIPKDDKFAINCYDKFLLGIEDFTDIKLMPRVGKLNYSLNRRFV